MGWPVAKLTMRHMPVPDRDDLALLTVFGKIVDGNFTIAANWVAIALDNLVKRSIGIPESFIMLSFFLGVNNTNILNISHSDNKSIVLTRFLQKNLAKLKIIVQILGIDLLIISLYDNMYINL